MPLVSAGSARPAALHSVGLIAATAWSMCSGRCRTPRLNAAGGGRRSRKNRVIKTRTLLAELPCPTFEANRRVLGQTRLLRQSPTRWTDSDQLVNSAPATFPSIRKFFATPPGKPCPPDRGWAGDQIESPFGSQVQETGRVIFHYLTIRTASETGFLRA
jgi:hypothetical protein